MLATLVAETFESFAGTGFASSPSASQLDSDLWRVTGLSDGDGVFGGNHTDGDFARGVSPGSIFSGGVYAFDVGGNRVLGAQPTSGDLTPGTFGLRVPNDSGSSVDQWSISFDLWYNNNESRANSVNLSYSTDDSNYVSVPSAEFTSPETADGNGWTSIAMQADLDVEIADGGFLYFKWDLLDTSGTGGRDEFGIDEVTVANDGDGGGSNSGGDVGASEKLDLRIVSYNVANRPLSNASENDFETVLSAIGLESVAGVQRDIDLLVLQETEPTSLNRLESVLDGLYSQNYAQVISSNFSGDYFGYLYNTETLTLQETERIDNVNYTRDPLRAKFRPVGSTDSDADFHVFNVHLNATDEARRQLEANGLRSELNTLGTTENFMVIGDLNIDSSSEGSYSTLTGNGSGQVFDPINAPGTWHNSNSFKGIHTQNPAGPMDDRFDFQLLNDDAMATGGLAFIPGSYRAFGNNGSHNLDQAITTGNGASSVVLSALADASDHLPVVVDYSFDIAAISKASVFYNDSSFDDSDDLDAVANKVPLLTGQTATFDNYSSYFKGINGMALDVQELASAPTLANIGDFFEFRRGNSDDVSSWTTAASPIELTYTADIDASGTDRVVMTWADEAIKNTWLEVTALANATTGLLAPISFYFGNAVGETGNDPANAVVNLADVASTRINQTGFGTAEIDNAFDFNRDGRVNLTDVALARTNQSGFTPLTLITPGASGRPSGFGTSGGGKGMGLRSGSNDQVGLKSKVELNIRDFGSLAIRFTDSSESTKQSDNKISVLNRDRFFGSLSDEGLSLAGSTNSVVDHEEENGDWQAFSGEQPGNYFTLLNEVETSPTDVGMSTMAFITPEAPAPRSV